MLFYKTFYVNVLRFSKSVFLMILKIAIAVFLLINALINVFFMLLSLDSIIIRFFTCFYFRFVSGFSRCSLLISLSMLLFSSLSYFPRPLITISIIIYLRFLNVFWFVIYWNERAIIFLKNSIIIAYLIFNNDILNLTIFFLY